MNCWDLVCYKIIHCLKRCSTIQIHKYCQENYQHTKYTLGAGFFRWDRSLSADVTQRRQFLQKVKCFFFLIMRRGKQGERTSSIFNLPVGDISYKTSKTILSLQYLYRDSCFFLWGKKKKTLQCWNFHFILHKTH